MSSQDWIKPSDRLPTPHHRVIAKFDFDGLCPYAIAYFVTGEGWQVDWDGGELCFEVLEWKEIDPPSDRLNVFATMLNHLPLLGRWRIGNVSRFILRICDRVFQRRISRCDRSP